MMCKIADMKVGFAFGAVVSRQESRRAENKRTDNGCGSGKRSLSDATPPSSLNSVRLSDRKRADRLEHSRQRDPAKLRQRVRVSTASHHRRARRYARVHGPQYLGLPV